MDDEHFLAGFQGVEDRLWLHQREAVRFISRYVEAFGGGDEAGSRLVSLPTGSGKSGIIATVCQFLRLPGIFLVVVPRDELRRQLAADIRGRFFRNAGIEAEVCSRSVELISRSAQFSELSWGEAVSGPEGDAGLESTRVFVTTIQLLERVWREDGRLAESGPPTPVDENEPLTARRTSDVLIDRVRLVMFDEGHYEPAPSWARVIRSFQAPRIVFTATPFRNDLRAFDWATSDEEVFFRSFQDMVDAGRIRDVVIEHTDLGGDVSGAVGTIERRRRELADQFGEDVEAIVRVGSRARVLEVADAVRAFGLKFIAVHHRGSDEEERRHDEPEIIKSYPIDHEGHVPYWIHQYKLLEGIDRPQIGLLVVLDRLASLRALVQQIGRITRKPSADTLCEPAVVLDPGGGIGHRWQRYQALEKSLREGGFAERTPQAALARMLRAVAPSPQYSPIYVEGNVRDLLSPREPNGPWEGHACLDWQEHVLIRRAAQVLQLPDGDEAWELVCEQILRDSQKVFDRMWRLDTSSVGIVSDYAEEARTGSSGSQTVVLLGISSGVSPFLVEHAFFDIRLDVSVAYRTDPYVFFFDSSGRDLRRISPSLQSGPPRAILQLLRQFEGQRLRSVSTKNTRMGPTATSSRTLRGVDLTRVPSTLDEGTHIVTSAAGYADPDEERDRDAAGPQEPSDGARGKQRRYVGVRARRVSDAGKMVTVVRFQEWAEEIAADMRRARVLKGSVSVESGAQPVISGGREEVLSYFSRFAPEATRVPEHWAPTWLLIDLAEYEGEYVLRRAAAARADTQPPNGLDSDRAADESVFFPLLDTGLVELHKDNGKDQWNGQLEVRGGGDRISVRVTFKHRVGRYELHSPVLDSFRPHGKPEGDTILQELNRSQSFSIVPEEDGFFYTMGAFYRPGLHLGPSYRDERTGLLEMVACLPGLRDVQSEKGTVAELCSDSTTWPDSSLFGLVDAAARGRSDDIEDDSARELASALSGRLGQVTWLVCDDMGAERADFIALTQRGEDRSVVLIHAKAKSSGSPSGLSATQMQTVCSQAVKNLDFLGPRLADHTRNWAREWSLSKEAGISISRFRVVPEDAREQFADDPNGLSRHAQEVFESAVSNPSVRREVWLLLGATLEKAALKAVLKAPVRRKEQVPAIYLLYATSTVVAASNAMLRVLSH